MTVTITNPTATAGAIQLGGVDAVKFNAGGVTSKIQSVTCTQAGSALTCGFNPAVLDFRDPVLTTGVPITRSIDTALSLVVPNGATLGAPSGILARLYLLVLDDAGTQRYGITNSSGGLNLDESALFTTTAISAGATAANVIYTTVAITTAASLKVVGAVNAVNTAGAWGSPTLVQGAGGNALAAMSSLGYGQIPQVVTRTSGITYYGTSKPIWLDVQFNQNSSGNVTVVIAGISFLSPALSSGAVVHIGFPIPPCAAYSITDTGTATHVATETR